jgi:intein/homing endonuclease
MKGTLFSADFIEDLNGELRLLEVNTDTSVTINGLSHFVYDDFINLLSTNNIVDLVVIHKPSIHVEIVAHLFASLQANATFLQSFTEIKEASNTIYPTTVEDSDTKFILRLAYDESAIFDSEYAKSSLNLFKLYADYNETGSIAEFFHSSSFHGEYNTITPSLNPNNLPDIVVKNISELEHKSADFYKIGSESESDTIQSRIDYNIHNLSNEDTFIQKYHINPNTVSDNKTTSIRTYSILCGSDLSLIHIAQFSGQSFFELPTGSIYDENLYVNKIDDKHYYEFATNAIKYEPTFDGILDTHILIKSDNSGISVGDIEVGDELKSYYIGGVNLSEDDFTYNYWKIDGEVLPAESYVTSSVVVFKNTKELTNKTLCKINVENNTDHLYVASNKAFLVYDSDDNVIRWKNASHIVSLTDYLYDYDGSKAQVTSNEIIIINEDNFSLVEIDVEDTDTYIISGSTSVNTFVMHNAPCFVAGTEITMGDGSKKNIEEVVSGDIVSTFDLVSNTFVNNKVNAVFSKKVNLIVEYKLENGNVLKGTEDHPLFIEGKGWCSFSPDKSNSLYSLEENIKSIVIGDVLKLSNTTSKILDIEVHQGEFVVYNLQDIEKNHNFFANDVLVHNRCFVAGTEITLANGDVKNIEDVVVGEQVLTYNQENGKTELGIVGELKSHEVNSVVRLTLDKENIIITTFEHPFFVEGREWVKAGELQPLDVCKKVDGSESVISNVEIIEETHTVYNLLSVSENHNFFANGILVHNKYCFIAGTKITMEDGSEKNIEDVVEGDVVLSFNETTFEKEYNKVTKLYTPVHDDLVIYHLSNNTSITSTFDHPYYIEDYKLASHAPELTNGRYEDLNSEVSKIKVGDILHLSDGSRESIVDIIELERIPTQTYIFSVENNHNFYANGILVHNKQ